MIDDLTYFSNNNFYDALDQFFSDLKIPLKSHTAQPTLPSQILSNTYDESNGVHQLMDDIYFMGVVDDGAFCGEESDKELSDIKAYDQDYDGILIFGVELNKRENGRLPTRSHLATITRLFNREFQYTPVNVVYKYSLDGNSYISFTSCERVPYKQEWREGEKVGKVSLLKDIDINNTHTGHLKILEELKVPASVNSFTELYEHWQEIFDISTLNKKFYKEISDWYFWAKRNVTFPDDLPELEDKDERNSINLIRLLTRVLFVWFIKEKNLVNEELFNKEKLKSILKDFDNPENSGNTIYYKAILQNLFFATLNRELEKREDPDDAFRKKYDENRDGNYGITNLFRYEHYFSIQQEEILEIFNQSPFLNGGLFECLDRIKKEDDYFETKENNMLRVDGFSDRDDNRLNVPDLLFFGEERKVDLSSDYGKKSRKYKQAPVKGLIKILKSYKFTIAENTPIEQDIALDPELLGKVFENLLASYNPETQETARKKTGSYYTPREIVNYMVDESLFGYLQNYLLYEKSTYIESGKKQTGLFGAKEKSKQIHFEEKININKWKHNIEELEQKLRILLSYSTEQPFDDEKTKNKIINALDNCKIIDPACGSGAFPMGILHKMVHILDKLDPNNEKWKDRQIKKAEQFEDIDTREKIIEDIEEAFRKNELNLDYGRKLYLIENCIFGVDIQPIAVQISKLRFFISLVAEQEVNEDKDNYAIRPLPNLETKFVAANTLIGIDKPDNMQKLFENSKIKDLEYELKQIRHKIFSSKTQKTKRKHREQDKQIRNKITKELTNMFENEINSLINNSKEKREIEHFFNLINHHGAKQKYKKEVDKRRKILEKKKGKYESKTHKTARQLANWNPYDQNVSSEFFDPEWMFDVTGFDVVIGNPPYIRADASELHLKVREQILNSGQYETLWEKWDMMVPFYEKGLKLLNKKGIHTYIASNAITTSKYARKLHDWIIDNYCVKSIDYFENINIFDAGVIPIVSIILKGIPVEKTNKKVRKDKFDNIKESKINLTNGKYLRPKIFKKYFSELYYPEIDSEFLKNICYISVGMVINADEKKAKGKFTKDDLISENKDDIHSREYIEGKNLHKYLIKRIRYLEWNTKRVPSLLRRSTFPELYEGKKILRGRVTKGTFDDNGIVCNDSIMIFKRFIDIQSVKNRSISMSISKNNFDRKGSKGKRLLQQKRNELENISENYNLKYLLAIINSNYAQAYLNNFRRHRLKGYFYPTDFRNLPIPKISEKEQKPFIEIVDEILNYTNSDDYLKNEKKREMVEDYITRIDQMVYNLYDLDDEEIEDVISNH